MKKRYLLSTIILAFCFITTTTGQVQSGSLFSSEPIATEKIQFAYFNSTEILDAMPDRVKAVEEINILNQKYKSELQVMQNDYNKKYSDFISYQNSMGDNIRLRRMQELYELERHMKEFMTVAQADIDEREKTLVKPLQEYLKSLVNQLGVENGYICIYDLASPSIAFVTPAAVDITPLLKTRLGIK